MEGRELFPVDEVELLDKVDEVLEGGVEVRLFDEEDDLLEVLVVDVGVDAEEALQDCLGYRHEVLGERHTCIQQRRMKSLPLYIQAHTQAQMCNIHIHVHRKNKYRQAA